MATGLTTIPSNSKDKLIEILKEFPFSVEGNKLDFLLLNTHRFVSFFAVDFKKGQKVRVQMAFLFRIERSCSTSIVNANRDNSVIH